MAQVLIVHASREGQSLRIAQRVAETLEGDGHSASVVGADPFPGLGGADGVVVVASVHMGRHPAALIRAIRAHRAVLEHMPNAFLSVCLAAAGRDAAHRSQADGYLQEFLRRAQWHPTVSGTVAGALRFGRYGPIKGRFMRALDRREGFPGAPGEEREFTDWSTVRAFAEAFAAQLHPAWAGRAPDRRAQPRERPN